MATGVGQAIGKLHSAVDALLAAGLDPLSDAELTDVVRDLEAASRRLAPVGHRVIAEVDRRGLADDHGCRETKAFLAGLLRLSRAEAKARVTAARRCGDRVSVSGEALEPLLPAVAAAQAAGEISPKHAALIGDTIDKLPSSVDEAGEVAGHEAFLVDQARQFTPETLKIVARRLLETVDPDGVLRDVEYRDRRRSLVIHQRPDGSVFGTFDGTAEFGELLLTTLDVLAAPKPAADGTPDPRSPEQRNHDGLADAMRLMIRSTQLPPANGVLATVVLTMTETQWRTEQGLAKTGHGALIPVREAKRIAGGETRLFPVVLSDAYPPPTPWLFRSAQSIHAYGTCHHIFTERERLAMAARDGGCTFPGCTVVGAERRASLLVRPRRRPTVERAKRGHAPARATYEAMGFTLLPIARYFTLLDDPPTTGRAG